MSQFAPRKSLVPRRNRFITAFCEMALTYLKQVLSKSRMLGERGSEGMLVPRENPIDPLASNLHGQTSNAQPPKTLCRPLDPVTFQKSGLMLKSQHTALAY